MIAGTLVRYVDSQNREKLGLLMNDTANDRSNADIVPLEGILGLGAIVLGPILLNALTSHRVAGAHPYWIAQPD